MADEQRPERPRRNARGGLNPNGMRYSRGLFGWVVFIALAVVMFLLLRLAVLVAVAERSRGHGNNFPFQDRVRVIA